MSLSTALNAAVTGLAVNQRGLEIASHNIGNSHTDGYSRKIIQQEAISTSSFGSGGVLPEDTGTSIGKYWCVSAKPVACLKSRRFNWDEPLSASKKKRMSR